MAKLMRRPPPLGAPGADILRQHHVQIAYVTTDLERACALMTERYGISSFLNIGGDLPTGDGRMSAALAWSGGVMYELIQAEGPGAAFYHQRLPTTGFAIRHHHLGYLVDSQDAWDALELKVAAERWPVALSSLLEGFGRALYIEAPELEHYLEFMLPDESGVQLLEAVPGS